MGFPTYKDSLREDGATCVKRISTGTMVADGLTRGIKSPQLALFMEKGEIAVDYEAHRVRCAERLGKGSFAILERLTRVKLLMGVKSCLDAVVAQATRSNGTRSSTDSMDDIFGEAKPVFPKRKTSRRRPNKWQPFRFQADRVS